MTADAARTITWLTVGPSACGSYRCYVPALTLARFGTYRSRFVTVSPGSSPTPGQLGVLRRSHAVILQRNVTDTGVVWMDACRAAGIPVVYELDDDLLRMPPEHPQYSRFNADPARAWLRRFLTDATHVIVSTETLKRSLCGSCGLAPASVSVAENHLHPSVWGPTALGDAPTSDLDDVVIGWQGSTTHDADFAVVVDALDHLVRDFPRVRVSLFGHIPPMVAARLPAERMDHLPRVPFRAYPKALRRAGFDIGIAPLADSAFNRAKSNVKWLEYSAARIPTVASRVAPYTASIVHGTTGLLADTPDDWYDALATLVERPDIRREVAARAFDAAWTRWSAATCAVAWQDAFDRALS